MRAAARGRTDVTAPVERGRAERVQAALYRIAELASSARDMQEFYREVHAVVGELMYASNFFIALYDDERQLISWPYYVDEIDLDVPDPNQWDAFGEGEATGTTAYVLRTGEPQLVTHGHLVELIEQGEIELKGISTEETTWLGVPLVADGHPLGVVAVQSYTRDVQYTEEDKELLAFVGQHIGVALSRARAIEETRQRNAELGLINSSSCRRSTTSSATRSGRSSTRRSSTSASTSPHRGSSTSRTRSSAACASPTSRSR